MKIKILSTQNNDKGEIAMNERTTNALLSSLAHVADDAGVRIFFDWLQQKRSGATSAALPRPAQDPVKLAGVLARLAGGGKLSGSDVKKITDQIDKINKLAEDKKITDELARECVQALNRIAAQTGAKPMGSAQIIEVTEWIRGKPSRLVYLEKLDRDDLETILRLEKPQREQILDATEPQTFKEALAKGKAYLDAKLPEFPRTTQRIEELAEWAEARKQLHENRMSTAARAERMQRTINCARRIIGFLKHLRRNP